MKLENRTGGPTKPLPDWVRVLTAPGKQNAHVGPHMAEKAINQLEARLHQQPKPQNRAFDLNFRTDGLHPSVLRAHEATLAWLNAIFNGEEPRWIFLHGRPGSGKTHLAREARKALGARARTQFWKCSRVTSMLRAGEFDLRHQLTHLDVLFLDDLGVDRSTDFMRAEWCNMLDDRLEKWTFITSNLSPAEIATDIHERLSSRLFRGMNTVVDMREADDYSFKLKKS